METLLNVPQGKFAIQRLPYRKNEKLRAWDAADEYLLQHIFEQSPSLESRILILNDSFGALVLALNKFSLVAISDSWLSQHATKLNLVENNLPETTAQLNNSLDWPRGEPFDFVIIKIPKTLAFLEDQLARLQGLITKKTVVIAAGMVKAIPSAAWKLLEKYIGVTSPSLARKKARLIFAEVALQQPFKNPYPIVYTLENTNYQLCNHANVFSRDSLDIGTRFLLAHLPTNTQAKDIMDLACGNGVVGLILASSHPSSKIYYIDESYMAIASAKDNFSRIFPQRSANYCVADGLVNFIADSMDLIICNPPFHQQNIIGNQIALSMFKQSYRVLRKGGCLWVIGNRHLGYHIELKRIFGLCDEVAANKKFIIWRVSK